MDKRISVSIRVQRLKNVIKLRGQLRHDIRVGRVPQYVDKLRTEQNTVLRQGSVDEILQVTQGIKKVRKGSSPALAGILTFSTEAQSIVNSLSYEEQNSLFLKAIEKFEQVVNTKVMNAVAHRDESAVHLHFLALPCQMDGVPHSKGFLSRPENLSRLQDAIAEVFRELGINRGVKKEIRKLSGEPFYRWVHRSVRQLHKDLPIAIAEKQKELEVVEKAIENLETKVSQRYESRAKKFEIFDYTITVSDKKAENEVLGMARKEIAHIRQNYSEKLKQIETENVQLKQAKERLQKENAQLKEENMQLRRAKEHYKEDNVRLYRENERLKREINVLPSSAVALSVG